MSEQKETHKHTPTATPSLVPPNLLPIGSSRSVSEWALCGSILLTEETFREIRRPEMARLRTAAPVYVVPCRLLERMVNVKIFPCQSLTFPLARLGPSSAFGAGCLASNPI